MDVSRQKPFHTIDEAIIYFQSQKNKGYKFVNLKNCPIVKEISIITKETINHHQRNYQ